MLQSMVSRVPGPGMLADDGFPERWDSLCCDHIFSRSGRQDSVFNDLLSKVNVSSKIEAPEAPAVVVTQPNRVPEAQFASSHSPRPTGTPRGALLL